MVRILNEPVQCKIATFNCKNLTVNSDNFEKHIWIANLIRTSNVDIISIQEVNKMEAIYKIIEILGDDEYGECHTNAPIDNSRIHEYIAFIYKKSKVRCVGCYTFTQVDISKYVGGTNKMMMRAPAYARFIIDNRTDIIVIGYHTNQRNPMYDCMRIKYNIAGICKSNKCNNIILLGDFNTHCNDLLAFGKLYKRGYKAALPFEINTNYQNTNQYDNILYNTKNCYIKESAQVHRDEFTYSDHCLVHCNFYIHGKMSENASTFTLSLTNNGTLHFYAL
jgi:endonuclease/exonuclease/phosphatase family metal-dependent hydrolase